LTSRYDAVGSLEDNFKHGNQNSDIPFQNVVITDIDAHAPANELHAAAIQHITKKLGLT